MSKSKQITITVQGTTIGILPRPEGDYISLTDMVRNFDGAHPLLAQCLRVTVGTPEENRILLNALREAL